MCFERAITIKYFDTFSDLIHKLTDRDERATHAAGREGAYSPSKVIDEDRPPPNCRDVRPSVRPSLHRMIPYDPNRKRINMLPASLPLPHPTDRPAPYNPRSLPGSEQVGDWPFSLANMICMAMTSNYLLRAEWQRRNCMSDHPVRSAGGSVKTTGQKRDRLFELPLPPRPFYSIPPSVRPLAFA